MNTTKGNRYFLCTSVDSNVFIHGDLSLSNHFSSSHRNGVSIFIRLRPITRLESAGIRSRVTSMKCGHRCQNLPAGSCTPSYRGKGTSR